MAEKKDAYKLAGGSAAFTVVLVIISFSVGWNLGGQLVGGLAIITGIFTSLTFWKPETFAPMLQGVLDYIGSLGQEESGAKVSQKQKNTKHSHQINGSGNKITYVINK